MSLLQAAADDVGLFGGEGCYNSGMAYFRDDDHDAAPGMYQNSRGGWERKEHVAERLVEGGSCGSYDEAYAVLNALPQGQLIRTYSGFVRKSGE